MEIGCTLKLPDDTGHSVQHRTAEISIVTDGAKQSGKWTLASDSKDPRINIGVSSGLWSLNYNEDDKLTTMYILRKSDYKILLELYGVSKKAIEEFGCGTSIAGDGSHLGPPQNAIRFSLWFNCI